MRLEMFEASFLEPLVQMIDAALRGRRAAAPVSSRDFRSRVIEHPGFDPAGLLVIREYGQLRGALHALLPPIRIPQYARLEGRAYIMGPFVAPEARGRGLGRRMLSAAESYLKGRCDRILVHGLRAPFYHAQEGPRQPYCGSSEMIGLTLNDAALLDFYTRAGYRIRMEEREKSMLAPLQAAGNTATAGEVEISPPSAHRPQDRPGKGGALDGLHPSASGLPAGVDWAAFSYRSPWLGPVDYGDTPDGFGYGDFRPMGRYAGLGLRSAGSLIGDCIWFPMRQPGRAALYSLRLAEDWRRRGLGRRLLDEGLRLMRAQGYGEVELHTSPQRNAVAYAMYAGRGFRDVADWIVLEKRL